MRTEKDRTQREQKNTDDTALYIEGRNAIKEALAAGTPIERAWILRGDEKAPVADIKKKLSDRGIPFKEVDRTALERMSRTGHHQGVIAKASAVDYSDLDAAFDLAAKRGTDPFLFMLDGIEDPHNFGAMIRTAEALGAHGVIVGKDRSAPLSETVVRTSAGAVWHLPIIRVTNLSRTIEDLKKRSVWVVCGDMDGTPLYDLDLTGPLCLVIGNEGHGVSRLVKEKCDFTASIPMTGEISSLNASVAAGMIAYEITRQRAGRK